MGKDTPWRRRENIVMLCKGIIKYAEGPGEIDSLVNEICDRLGDLTVAMAEAHARALEEQAAVQDRYDQRKELLADVPKWMLKKVVLEYFKAHPEELPIDDSLDVLNTMVDG